MKILIDIKERKYFPLINKRSIKALSKSTGVKYEILQEKNKFSEKHTSVIIEGSHENTSKFIWNLEELKQKDLISFECEVQKPVES